MARRITYLLSAAALLLVVASPALAAVPPLTAQWVDTSDYPTVRARIAVPPELLGESGEAPEFSVLENGEPVDGVTVKAIDAASVPQEVVLVLDSSGSMQGEPLVHAREAASAFLDALAPEVRVALMTFPAQPQSVGGFTEERASTRAVLSGLRAGGSSAIYDAVIAAASLPTLKPAAQRTIVLLSDGADRGSGASLDATIKTLKTREVSVLAVALRSEEYDPAALRSLSAGTGGRLTEVAESTGLTSAFQRAAEDISSRYELTYTSGRPRTKDVEIDVTAKAGGRESRLQTAYANPSLASLGVGPAELSSKVRSDPALFALTVLASFVSVVLGALGVLALALKERTRMDQLRYYDQLRMPEQAPGRADDVRAKVVAAVGYVASKRGLIGYIRERLESAGLPLRPAEFITAHLVVVIVAGSAAQLLLGRFGASLLVVAVVTVGPLLYLQIRASRRLAAFEEQLPDILALIAGSLRAGWGLQQAVDNVVQEASPPASLEFKRVQTETRLGMPLDEALEKMAGRLGSEDFEWVVTAIAIQREVGGNLAEVLDIVAGTIRERAALRRHVSALTSEGRLSAYILVGLPFLEALVLSVVNPTYINRLFGEPLGVGLVVTGLSLMGIGAYWLRAVTRIEV